MLFGEHSKFPEEIWLENAEQFPKLKTFCLLTRRIVPLTCVLSKYLNSSFGPLYVGIFNFKYLTPSCNLVSGKMPNHLKSI